MRLQRPDPPLETRSAMPNPLTQASAGRESAPAGFLARLSTTRANARAGLVADSAVSVLLVALGLRAHTTGAAAALLALASGVTLFSFVEYAFHRWLFHGRAGRFAAGHRQHHHDPYGDDALPFFVPPLLMLALARALALLLPAGDAMLLAGALAAGYAAYGLAHTAIHRLRFRRGPLMRWAACHHVHHHHPDRNFGVTSPLWDVVLGTRHVRAGRAPERSAGT